MWWRVCAGSVLMVVLAACTRGPSTADVDLDYSTEETPDGIVVSFASMVPEGSTSVEFDFGDGTTFVGQDPPPHLYPYDGVYNPWMTVLHPDLGSIGFPLVLNVFGNPFADERELLRSPANNRTELHAINNVQVSTNQVLSTVGHLVALRQLDGELEPFSGPVSAEVTALVSPGSQDVINEVHTLVEGADGIHQARLLGVQHASHPVWSEDGAVLSGSTSSWPSVNFGNQFALDYHEVVGRNQHSLAEPLEVSMRYSVTSGGVDLWFAAHQGDQLVLFEPTEPNGTSGVLSVEELSGFEPGVVQIYAVAMGRPIGDSTEDVHQIYSWLTRSGVLLTE